MSDYDRGYQDALKRYTVIPSQRSHSSAMPTQYDLSKAGRVGRHITDPENPEIRLKEDDPMLLMPVGQSFAQPSIKAPAFNPNPTLEFRPQTYRHAAVSARRNFRHQWNSMAMPSSEVNVTDLLDHWFELSISI